MRRFAFVLALLAVLVVTPQASAWSWPLRGDVLRPYSLGPDPYAAGQHRGVDVAGSAGEAVRAPAAGIVSFVGVVPSSGRTVTIQTDGYAVSLTHLGETTVAKGATVAEGDAVGVAGQSGEVEWPTPYVHLGIRVSSAADGYIDPATLLPPRDGGSSASARRRGRGSCTVACPGRRRRSRALFRRRRRRRALALHRARHCSARAAGAAAAAAPAPVAPREPAATASATAPSTAAPTERDRERVGQSHAQDARRHAACRSNPAEPARHGSAGWLGVHRGSRRIARPSGCWLCRRRAVRVSPRASGANGAASRRRRLRRQATRPARPPPEALTARTARALPGGAPAGSACGSRSSRRCGHERASPAARS